MPIVRIQKYLSKQNANWVVIDELGLPRYWATVWSFFRLADQAESTVKKKLSFLDAFYRFTDTLEFSGCLDIAIAEIDIKKLGSYLEAYFIHLQGSHSITSSTQLKWKTQFDFIKDCLFWLSKNQQNFDKYFEVESRVRNLSEARFSGRAS